MGSTIARAIQLKPGQQRRAVSATTRSVIMLAFCGILASLVGAIVWATGLQPLSKYLIALALYGIMTAVFIGSRVRRDVWPIFEFPVTLSILAYIQFGLAPLYLFFTRPDDLPPLVTEGALVEAFPMCVIGMFVFWVGTAIVRRREYVRPDFTPKPGRRDQSPRLLAWAIAMFASGFAVQFGLNVARYSPGLDTAQFVLLAGQLATLSLVIVTIEIASNPGNGWFKALFCVILPAECVVGFFSGMKGLVLVNIAIVGVVTWICRQSIPRKWLLAGVGGLVLLYPLVNAMRDNHGTYNIQTSDVDSAIMSGEQAFRSADRQGSWIQNGIEYSIIRLDLLSSVTQVRAFGSALEFLDSGDRMWMVPFYTFVPRFVWKEKPTLDQGSRFSVLLGGSTTTSVSLSYVGDAYRRGGWPGVVLGMLLWGMLAEGLVQLLYRRFTKARLLVYISMTFLATASPLEALVFNIWSGELKQVVLVSAIAMLVYGRREEIQHQKAGSMMGNHVARRAEFAPSQERPC